MFSFTHTCVWRIQTPYVATNCSERTPQVMFTFNEIFHERWAQLVDIRLQKKRQKIFLIVYYFTIHILFQRDKSRWMSSSNTGTTVLYWFVRDGKFSQIMSDHLRLQDNTKSIFSASFLLLDTNVLFSNTHTLLVSDLYWLNKQCLSAFVDKLGKKNCHHYKQYWALSFYVKFKTKVCYTLISTWLKVFPL